MAVRYLEMSMNRWLIPLVVILLTCNAQAELIMTKIFSDNMVLQRGMSIPVWGWSSPGVEVLVEFKGRKKSAVADVGGKWMLRLEPLPASLEPETMTIQSGNKRMEFRNVLVGDVWICSGQSNMGDDFAYPLNSKYPSGKAIADELRKIDNPLIRIVDRSGVGKIVPVPLNPPVFPYFGWEECNSKTAKRFSRVGYYFGEKLQKELKIPIGLINVSRGCSSIEAWMPPEAFDTIPAWNKYSGEVEGFQRFYCDYDHESIVNKERILLDHCNSGFGAFAKRCYMKCGKLPVDQYDNVLAHMLVVKPSSLYNHAIRAIMPFGFKGVIWYQGETNVVAGDTEYAKKQQVMIECWRRLWNQGDFPFYIVQLAPCLDGKDAALPDFWMQQYEAVGKTANSGLISAVDIGNCNEYHPENKRDVGLRLALLALRDAYGEKNVIACGPTYKTLMIANGKAIIKFSNTGSGLMTNDGKAPSWFEVAGDDKTFVEAEAEIVGNNVVVSNPSVKNPVYVRYAWSGEAHTNLANKEGLPALPFNTAETFFQKGLVLQK